MGLFDKLIISSDRPNDEDVTVKALIHHFSDWVYCQGMESQKLKNELNTRYDKKCDELEEIREKVYVLTQQLEEKPKKVGRRRKRK